jgi:hypothetical protein
MELCGVKPLKEHATYNQTFAHIHEFKLLHVLNKHATITPLLPRNEKHDGYGEIMWGLYILIVSLK